MSDSFYVILFYSIMPKGERKKRCLPREQNKPFRGDASMPEELIDIIPYNPSTVWRTVNLKAG
jgi:hypothetical protein